MIGSEGGIQRLHIPPESCPSAVDWIKAKRRYKQAMEALARAYASAPTWECEDGD